MLAAVGFRHVDRCLVQRARRLISAKTLLLHLRITVLVLLVVLRSHRTPLLHTTAMFLLGGERALTERQRVTSALELRCLVRVHVRESTRLVTMRLLGSLVEA